MYAIILTFHKRFRKDFLSNYYIFVTIYKVILAVICGICTYCFPLYDYRL